MASERGISYHTHGMHENITLMGCTSHSPCAFCHPTSCVPCAFIHVTLTRRVPSVTLQVVCPVNFFLRRVRGVSHRYGVATMSRFLQIIGLFCRILSLV